MSVQKVVEYVMEEAPAFKQRIIDTLLRKGARDNFHKYASMYVGLAVTTALQVCPLAFSP